MARDVDPRSKNLSDDDKRYLIQRAQMPLDVMSAEEQRRLVDPELNVPGLEQRANTGDANTANLSIKQLEKLLEARKAEAAAVDTSTLMSSTPGPGKESVSTAPPDGTADADDDEEDDDALEPPYEQYSKAQLSAEIQRRNEKRDEDEKLSIAGKHAELVARLVEDDESDDEDEGE